MDYDNPSRIRRRVKLASLVFAVLALLVLLIWLPPVRFTLLNEFFSGRRSAITNFLVKSLGQSEWGLRLAANDMTGTGGSNLGLSFVILSESSDIKGLHGILDPIAIAVPKNRNSKSIGRCFQANLLLWKKTERKEYLVRIFELLSTGGTREASIGTYRRTFISHINNEGVRELLEINGELDLPVIADDILDSIVPLRN